jgi:hypothetical protein
MRRIVLFGLALVAGCSGGGLCDDACEKMAKCLGFSSGDGGADLGPGAWQCPLGGDVCDPQKKCFAKCNLDATCEEIKAPQQPSPYRTCREACMTQYFGADGGAADAATSLADSAPTGDLPGQYALCTFQSQMLLGGCEFSWSCVSGETLELKCQQEADGQACTCKNKNKGTTEGSFSSSSICSELPADEVTDHANKSCGWKIEVSK